MNQTYTIEDTVEIKKSENRAQIKKRLGQMRLRAQKMISKHNWQKFVNSNGHLVSDESIENTIFNRTKLSKIDINYSGLDENTKINLMPLLLNKTEFTESQNSKMLFQQEEEFKLTLPKMPKQRLSRQDSVTFIADLASTSTPRKSQPITSTPKKSNHNPLVYHPTKTIRSKSKKPEPISSTKIYKLNIETFDIKLIKSTKRKLSDESSECKNCNICESAKKSKKISQKLKLKGSNFEFSLEDLLYKPIKRSKRSIELAQSSKVYYL